MTNSVGRPFVIVMSGLSLLPEVAQELTEESATNNERGARMGSVDISVKLLGPVLVEVDGRPVAGFRSHKTLALLAFLIVERRPVARNYLAELFWPDATTAGGRGHLRRALHDLSQKLPGALQVDYYTAQFNPGLFYRTDLAHFEALCVRDDTPSLELAGALCHGQFMEGMVFDDCPIFETWLVVEQEAWLRKAAGVLDELLRRHIATLRFDLALGVAWQLLRLTPWREDRYQQLMVLLARNGDLAQAMKVYKRYRRDLVEELAVEPSPEIEALHDRIRQARARRPGNLPGSLTPFVGRTHELMELTRVLSDPTCRLVTLVGPGGIGKTRLAVNAAMQATSPTGSLFLDGAYLVRLDAVTTPMGFLAAVAQALGLISGTAPGVTPDMVLRRIQDRELLLLLDDYDGQMYHRNLLLTLLEGAPGLKLLVTCQERLRLPAERVYSVKGLAVTTEGDGAVSEALAFFQASLQTYGRPLSANETPLATRVCELVGGMPLAIELAAAWTSAGTLHQLVSELECNLDVLASDGVQSSRHSSVRAVLDSTWQRLKTAEREVLRLLAVFPGEFSAEAAMHIVQIAPWQLQALADKSLLEITDASDKETAVRYHLPALIRQYAVEKLAHCGELHARVRTAHLDYLYGRTVLRGAVEFITADEQRPSRLAVPGLSRGSLSKRYIIV